MYELRAWNKETNTIVIPERLPNNGEWARHPSGVKKEYHAPVVPVEIPVYTTANEQVTVNGNPTQGFNSVYFGLVNDSINMSMDLVDGEGVKQTQIDQVALGYPTTLVLPILKTCGGVQVLDEKYLVTTIVAGVITITGSFPSSGNWQLTADRINASLAEINADWQISKETVSFRIA